jgi:hypothetical protein
MEAKDIITAAIATLALIVSFVSLWRAFLADRRSWKLGFEQDRQDMINLFLENELAEEARLRKLTQLRTQVADSSSISNDLDQYIVVMELYIVTLRIMLRRLEEVPSSIEASVGLKALRGIGEQHKRYASYWDNHVTEFVQAAHRITALEVALRPSRRFKRGRGSKTTDGRGEARTNGSTNG